jgi:hypothetical protein
MPIGGDQIPARGLTSGEGQVGEKVQELTAVTGVAGVGEQRGWGGVLTANRGGRVAGKSLGSFLTMMWC